MSIKQEKTENKNELKLTFTVEAEKFDKAILDVFKKSSKYFNIPGFRKGRAPFNIVEKYYGAHIFYEDAFNELVPSIYDEEIKANKIDAVSRPKIDVVQMEKGKDLIFTAIVSTKPEVKLGKYKGIEIKKPEYKVTAEDVEHELNHMAEHNSRMVTVEDRPAKDQDMVTIDFEGFVDGKAFEGGKAEGHQLTIGSKTFIPGFEEALIGMNKGEEKDIDLTFPEDYMSEELKGQKVVFKVKVNEIKTRVVPEINKEFFEDLGMEGVTTKEELEHEIHHEIEHQKEHEMEHVYEEKCLDKAASNMKADICQELIDDEVEHMYKEFMERMQMQGISEEMYYEYTKSKKEDITKQMLPDAEKRIKYRYLLKEIIKKEKIKVTDKEAKEQVKEMAKMYNVDEEVILKEISLENIKFDKMYQKALDIVCANDTKKEEK